MLDNIIKFSIKNKFIVGLMTLALVVWGLWSAVRLPIDAQPDITNNQVQIITLCPTLAGQEVEQLVTFPIEQSVVNLPDLEEVRSISRFGLSVVTVVFQDNVDIYFARQLVAQQLQQVAEDIPPSIGRPEMAPVSTGLGEVYQYILHPKKGSESKYTPKDLRSMQDWIVARQLNGTPGIAEVNSFGGQLKQYEVAVVPYKLKSFGISIADVFTALENNNENTGGAYIEKNPNAYFIRGVGLVTTLEDIGNIVVRKGKGAVPIYIKDIAEVGFGSAVRYGALTYNGEVDAVGGIVMMLKGGNAKEVVDRIKEKLPTIQKSLPEDILIEPYLDRTDLVGRAMDTVQKNLIEGALIVIFVLVIFLGNMRAGLIVASAIPLSLLFALGMMHVFGVSANLMSLGAIDFGLIVDGSVIVVEATMHHLGLRKSKERLTQEQMDNEVFESAAKIRTSAAFGEIIILIVYIPILTLVGIEGKMFRPMAMTVGFAIIGALILSFTYIPMMCALVLPKKWNHKKNLSDKLMDFLQKLYLPVLEKALRFKKTLVAFTVGLLALSLWLFRGIGAEFLPTLGEGDFAYHCILPQGTSLSQSIVTSMQASRILKSFDEVKMVVGKTGTAEVPMDPMPPEATDLVVVLKPPKEWKVKKSYEELADEMNAKLANIPGVFFEQNQPIQMRFNELMTGIRQDVAVKVFGENLDTLLNIANKINESIKSVGGVTEPQVERVSGLPQISIDYDRTRLANYGINVKEVNDLVSMAFAGKAAGVVYENERRFDLVVRLDSASRGSINDVKNLMVAMPDGDQIPLSQIANINYKLGPAQISRENGKRRIYIGFNVKGRDVASVVNEIQDNLENENLPSGYYLTYGGQFENLQAASQRLMMAVPLSLALIFMLLYFTFHSAKQATMVFAAIPMSAIGGVFALMARGMPFSISAGIGFIALFGIAVLNGIVLITTFNRLAEEGWDDIKARVIEGTKTRLRPVLMTATVASLGFLPMAISTGAGAEVQKPLATVVIGGLISATLLTLFVLPILYILFESKNKNKNKVNMKPILTIAFVLFSFGTSTTVIAQSKVINEADAINIAMKNSFEMQAKANNISAARSSEKSAFELPKTQLTGEYGNNEGFYFNDGVMLSQSIPFPTLFGAKRKLFETQTQVKMDESEMSALELRKRVRTFYYQLEYFKHNADQLQYLDSIYTDFVRIASLRYKTGDTKKLDIQTAKTKQIEIQLLLQQNEVYLQNAYRSLKSLMQMEEDFSIAQRPFAPMQIAAVNDNSVLANHPSIKMLEHTALVAEHNKKVERAQSAPDFNFGYNNISLIGNLERNGAEQFYGRSQRFSYVNFGLTLPLTYGATKARIKSLDYQKQAAEAEAKQQLVDLSIELSAELNQYEQLKKQFDFYTTTVLPNIEEMINAAQLSYKTGESSNIEYLYTLGTASDTQLKYLALIQQINQAAIQINSIINK